MSRICLTRITALPSLFSMKFQLSIWWIVYYTNSIICNLFTFLNRSECQLARASQLDLLFVLRVLSVNFVNLYMFVWVAFVYICVFVYIKWDNFENRVHLSESNEKAIKIKTKCYQLTQIKFETRATAGSFILYRSSKCFENFNHYSGKLFLKPYTIKNGGCIRKVEQISLFDKTLTYHDKPACMRIQRGLLHLFLLFTRRNKEKGISSNWWELKKRAFSFMKRSHAHNSKLLSVIYGHWICIWNVYLFVHSLVFCVHHSVVYVLHMNPIPMTKQISLNTSSDKSSLAWHLSSSAHILYKESRRELPFSHWNLFLFVHIHYTYTIFAHNAHLKSKPFCTT